MDSILMWTGDEPQSWIKRIRTNLARLFHRAAERLDRSASYRMTPTEIAKLPFLHRLDSDELAEGRVQIRYCALDLQKSGHSTEDQGLIPLQHHLVRLYQTLEEVRQKDSQRDWSSTAENLFLAASLQDVFADTDVAGSGSWCSMAADYDDVNNELTEKFLASTVVFTFAWTAYESVVKTLSATVKLGQPKGARGRELIIDSVGTKYIPYLRQTVMGALHLNHDKLLSRSMAAMLTSGSLAGIGAEHLRQFRNAVIHGDFRVPHPRDWGPDSTYKPDLDLNLYQFLTNTRLILLLIQLLVQSTLKPEARLAGWLLDDQPGRVLLAQLHCEIPEPDQSDLPFLEQMLMDPD